MQLAVALRESLSQPRYATESPAACTNYGLTPLVIEPTFNGPGSVCLRETTTMPYRIRWEGHGVYRRFFGVITLAEFREANKEMRSDVRYEGIRYIISDYLEAEPAPNITERDLKAYARQERVHFFGSPDIVQAIVTTDPKNVTLARYYESLGISPYCTADFATVADARAWLASNPRRGWMRPSLDATSTMKVPHV
jgi:hypothetical protein